MGDLKNLEIREELWNINSTIAKLKRKLNVKVEHNNHWENIV